MTREEAIVLFEKQLTAAQVVLDSGFGSNPGENDSLYRRRKEMAEIALSALRPVSREQVEKVWRGEWVIGEPDVLGVPIHCSRCGWGSDHADQRAWIEYKGHIFCGHCGAPMTDEAVEMVMERLEALYENRD